MDQFMRAAIDEAQCGLAEGGIPIGSVRASGTHHRPRPQPARAAGQFHPAWRNGRVRERRPSTGKRVRESVLYTTLSPCPMCSGAILLYGIPNVIVGENRTFMGEEDLLRQRGVHVEVLQDETCVALMREFIAAKPALWNEDIGT